MRGSQTVSESLKRSLRRTLYRAPWFFTMPLFRLFYRFRVEGRENLPAKGPFILVIREPTLIGVLVSGWLTIEVLLAQGDRGLEGSVAYMQDYMFALSYFRRLVDSSSRTQGRYRALLTHSAGRMALSLVEGYRGLRDGGIVTLNPYGEGSWDGRPVPLGHSLPWLGLHSAAPVVPAICSIDAYDIWPRWRMWPSLRGRLRLRIGQPFRLCDSPQQKVTEEDLAAAVTLIEEKLDQLCYGEGGVAGWMGPATRAGEPVDPPVRVRVLSESDVPRPAPSPSVAGGKEEKPAAVWKRGIAQLLWRCPVCCRDDALLPQGRVFRCSTLLCQACGTRWEIRRLVSRDFRLLVVDGPPDLIGLEMALSAWYDEMKREFQPAAIQISEPNLLPGEEAYLQAGGVTLSAHRPTLLQEDWSGCEPPQTQPPGRPALADWADLGEGRCVLTNQRLLWQGPRGELDFQWSCVTALYLWLVNTLGITYGRARYRFELGEEVGLKWLTYAVAMAQQAEERDGHRLAVPRI